MWNNYSRSSYIRNNNNSKNTFTYKLLKLYFRYYFFNPDYVDYIKDGVSFKWSYDFAVKNRLGDKGFSEFFEEILPFDLYRILEFKTLPESKSRPDPLRYGRENNYRSLRILARLRGLK